MKSENIEARALGWSPKGKQLTVGLADGTLKLFKPDLTAVRSIQRPPMDEAGAVLSITWFTNTEFFIGYVSSVEEGAHVIMYVNAPKAKEPRFVAYEYVCNYNQGPQPPMFYPLFFPEWSLLCLLSSRAVSMAVLGRPAEAGEGSWCEYEIDEGCVAAVHNVSITQETFPLGLAVDFTSQKTFTAKDNKVSGPCPVLYTLSTGGELNLFHIINEKSGAEPLIKPLESLPTTGLRTPQQFGGVASYSVGKAAIPSLPTASSDPRTAFPATQTPLASSSSPAPQKVDPFSFNTPAQTSASVSASPLQGLSASFKLPQTQPSPLTTSLFAKTEPASTPFFNLQGTTEGTKPVLTSLSSTPKLPQTTTSQDFKFPSFPLTQLSTTVVASSSATTITATTTTTLPDIKPQPPVVPRVPEVLPQSVAATPPQPPQAVMAELDDTLLSTIEAAKTSFERELEDHINMGDLPNQVGGQEEMGGLRCCLSETAEWVDGMGSTTSELKGEVGQLHSEVLEGFILAEEAEVQVVKSKNPRHRLMLQPQTLDPHSRKQMEEIRSLYQYLQSQLAEIDTRLHLDWAAYRNEQNKKKKKELPASETLYQALKKCHYARKVCERRVDTLCERIKDLHLHSLSGLAASQTHQEEDEILATLERSLRETSISTPPFTSPFKMLSPGKQESLQKVLSQRNFIPLRKCSNLPRMNLSSLEDLSPGHSHEGSPRSSLTTNKPHLLLESFGPQTFSTPMRNNQTPITSQTRSTSEARGTQESEAVPAPAPEPQYEDITPPQTPDNRLTQGTKPASPLRALSRLVSEVPTTGASETKVPGTALLAEGKTTFRGFGDGGSSSGGLKAPVTVTSGPLQGAFKPVTSAPLSKTTLAFSFTQFVPPSVASQGSVTQQSMVLNLGGGSNVLFKPPTVASENTSFSQAASSETSQKTEVKSSFFFKPPVSASESNGQSSEKPETSSAPQDKLPSPPPPSTSQVQSVLEAGGSSSLPTAVNVPQSITTTLSSVAETDSTSSSSSTDSDTASNTTVIGDSASISGASNFPEGSQQSSERVGDTTINKEFSLIPSRSTSQLSLFSANSGNFFGGGSGSMFGGASSSGGGFFGTKTSVESGLLGSSTTTTTTTTTPTTTTATSTGTPASVSLFAAPTTVSGGFFASAATAASGSVFSAPTTTSGIIFGAKTTESSSKGLLGTDTTATTTITTTVTSGLFGKTATTTTTAGNSLGTVASTSAGNIFETTKVSTGGTIFGAPATSSGGIFGTSTATASASVFGTASTSNGSIFGITGTTTGSIFGTTPAATTTATTGTVFGDARTTAAALNSTTVATTPTATTASIFATANTATTNSIFGASTAASSTTDSGSIFGVKTTTGSMFGATSTSGNLFGTTSSAPTGSIFGTTSTSTGSGSLFGSAATTGSIFGAASQTSAATPSIFGSAASSSAGNTSTTSLFGGDGSVSASTTSTSTTTTAASTSISAASSPPDLTTGLFSSPPAGESPSFSLPFTSGGGPGSPSPPTSATPTLFSTQPTATTTGVPFSPGGVFSASSTTSTSAFTNLPASTSVFTSPASSSAPALTPSSTATVSSSNTVFGQATPGLVFGGTASPQTSLFGGGGQSTAAFGTSPPSGSIFGGSQGAQSLFGNTSSGSVFGQTSAASTSLFSSASTSKAESSPFGGSSAFGSGGGGGGGFFSGLGSKPSAENVNKNVFGGASLSSAAPQTSLFGNSSSSSSTSSPFQGSLFGGASSTSGNSGTGTGSFTGGGGPVANTGFAVTTPQTPAFGGSPTFGGGPAFGGSPTFGSPPVFGGSSTFSSPMSSSTGGGFSTFASSGSATFGSIAGSSSSGSSGGFGSFATQGNTASFGSLAQQSPEQSSGGGFGTGGGGGNTFGSGSSFSAWR